MYTHVCVYIYIYVYHVYVCRYVYMRIYIHILLVVGAVARVGAKDAGEGRDLAEVLQRLCLTRLARPMRPRVRP